MENVLPEGDLFQNVTLTVARLSRRPEALGANLLTDGHGKRNRHHQTPAPNRQSLLFI
jgi:hypothetical protein